jgi:hypothetical protein
LQEEDEGAPRRVSSIVEVAHLFAELVRHGLRTLCFCTTRKLSELVLQYAIEALQDTGHHALCGLVTSYRGGYTPEQRRDIERKLFRDELRGVTATNALELGVDVGSMDATLHLGFQRSISSLWQQAGRAGRRNHKSLSIYVAWDAPIDQYFVQHPELLFGMALEATVLNLSNADILAPHLLCAASEAELCEADASYFDCAALRRSEPLSCDTQAEPLRCEQADASCSGGGSGSGGGGGVFAAMVRHLVEKGHAALGCLEPLAPQAPAGGCHALGGGGGARGTAAQRRWAFCGGPKPQRSVSLRSIDHCRWAQLYWYKSTSTDAGGAARIWAHATFSF